MPEQTFILPDGKKVIVFETNQHPDFQGQSVNINEGLNADIPTYQVVTDGISTALNKNIFAIFNRNPVKRIRLQEVYIYPKTLANYVITVQLGYTQTLPTGGTPLTLIKHAFDFPDNLAAPNDVVALAEPTGVTPIPNIIFGGVTFSVNVAGSYTVFKPERNASALQIRPGGVEGVFLRITSGTGTAGSVTAHATLTLD